MGDLRLMIQELMQALIDLLGFTSWEYEVGQDDQGNIIEVRLTLEGNQPRRIIAGESHYVLFVRLFSYLVSRLRSWKLFRLMLIWVISWKHKNDAPITKTYRLAKED